MSISANISIKLIRKNDIKISSIEILDNLISYGWRLDDYGKKSYLPLGDKGNFDWVIQKDLTTEELRKIIIQKEKAGETVGVVITWKDTLVGGSILSDKQISFNLDINRKTMLMADYSITDFQWYLEKLLPPLNDSFGVEYFAFREHI